MSDLNQTTRGNRLHIAIFGRRNAGKSSIINAITKQEAAIVSEIAGTTTDPVYKAMEVLPLGPVVFIDTAGLDDEGELGDLRIAKTLQVMAKTDMALVVVDATIGVSSFEKEIIAKLQERKIVVLLVFNKTDKLTEAAKETLTFDLPSVKVSIFEEKSIEQLKASLLQNAPQKWDEVGLLEDIVRAKDVVVMVTPIDAAAPKGRMILPQVQVLRDVLDRDALAYIVKETELKQALISLKEKPRIVITDSQAFAKVSEETPNDILLTSFSILFARFKGELLELVKGAKEIGNLKAGERVLIAEACTHHRVQDDIGTVKLPKWLNEFVGGDLSFSWCSGNTFPERLEQYKLIIHCGACMVNRREMLARMMIAKEKNVYLTNYGIAIAYLNGILSRVLSPFPKLQALLDE